MACKNVVNFGFRGLSRSSLDQHPLPEDDDDDEPSSHSPIQNLQEADSAHNSSQTSDASGHSDCPTVIPVDSNQSWSGIHSCTGTGVSTERSSVFSWGYDEFDKAVSRQVQQMFDEIDKELYEGTGSGDGILQGLQEECQQWTARFPHLRSVIDTTYPPGYETVVKPSVSPHYKLTLAVLLRILGTQLLHPNDEGYQWYSTPLAMSPAGSSSAGEEDSAKSKKRDEEETAELNVQGRRAALIRSSSVDLDDSPCFSSSPCSQETSQEIEVEGQMEEYLAFDSRDLEDELDCSKSVLAHHCQPPLSPHRCRRQAVLDLLFENVWQEVVGWMKELVQRHWDFYSSCDEAMTEDFHLVQFKSQSATVLGSVLPTTLPRLNQGRVPPLTAAPQLQNTESKGSKHKSKWKSKKQKRPPASGRAPVGSQHNLNELMVIHSIPLQHRNLGPTERSQEQEELAALRPESSAGPSGKPRPRRALEQSSSSLSHAAQSARRRNAPPRNLQPLVPSSSQSSTGVSLDEVIRGKRLPTASDRLTSPLLALSRNTLLPPIGTSDLEPSHSGQLSRLSQRHKGPSSRAHSAINDEARVSVLRDRPPLMDVFSRPNTTHTYRSDTPYHRSVTVLDNIGQSRTGRAADALGFGVTGVSLGISSLSFLDSFAHHPLGHSPIKDEEEPLPQSSVTAPPVPVSVPQRSHSRGGISSRSSRPGL